MAISNSFPHPFRHASVLLALAIAKLSPAAPPPEPIRRCEITVVQERKSGEKSQDRLLTKDSNESECKKSAELHRSNFAPQVVKRKTVTYRWLNP